jgi:PAS domain S-box-containing protein
LKSARSRSIASLESQPADTQDGLSLQVKALARLHDLAMRLAGTSEPQPALEAVLDTIVEAHTADFGSLSLVVPATERLAVCASAGFDHATIERFSTVLSDPSASACGKAALTQERAVICDIELESQSSDFRSFAESVGIQSLHSTPILTRAGEAIGVLSVYFNTSRLPTEWEMQLADLCARHAAEAIEAAKAQHAIRESEERLRLATQTGKVGIWDWDIVANHVSWTDSLYLIHGVKPDEFTSTVEGFSALVHPEDRDFVAQAIQRALDFNEPYELEFRAVRPDGDVIWLFTNATILRAQGRPVRMLGATMDITAMKRAQLAARESQERFVRFMQHLPGLAWIKDAGGKYVFANEAAHKAFQTTPAKLYGKSDLEVFPQETARRYRENDQAALASETGYQTVETLEHKDGTLHYSLVHKFPIPGADGAATLIGGMAIDITDRKQAEESLRASEERFRTLADHAPVGIFQTGPDGKTVFVNKSWCAMTGLSPSEAQGDGWTNALHPEDRRRVTAGWNLAVRKGIASEAEFRFVRHDGTVTWMQGNAVPLRSVDGELIGYIGTVADVTQRKASEIALRESEERFRHMADHAPVMIWVTEADGQCTFLGKTWYDFTGRTPETSLGFGWIEAVHPDDREAAKQAFLDANERHVVFGLEYRLRDKHGQYHWVIDAGMPRTGDDGQFLGFIGSVIDITDRKKYEEELREADRRKDEFLAVLAHELRNPLAPIRTGLELMRLAGDDSTAIEEVRTTMERQSQQMVRLIDDLLDVSRITRGAVELRKSRVELAAIVESAIETSRPLIEEMGHKLEVTIPKQPIVLEADATRLSQVISNLLNNAAKYTPRGGHVGVSAERVEGMAIISVKDSGIGIPSEMLESIFDMFTQVDGSLERSHGGLGIGLTLVKRLVEMHGGSIEARSFGANQGSEFTVRLPAVVGLLNEPPQSDGQGPAQASKRRILVVDDNENAAKVLGMLLTALGNEVRTAFDGISGIELAESFLPEIILLDIGMPKLNGYETARRIREQPWGKNMVLAALTGWGQEEDKRRTREAGFDHHFVKPVEPAVLQKLLAEYEPATH